MINNEQKEVYFDQYCKTCKNVNSKATDEPCNNCLSNPMNNNIEMGIHHLELSLPWDKPVPPELWSKVCEYCANDVVATEASFDYLSHKPVNWEKK